MYKEIDEKILLGNPRFFNQRKYWESRLSGDITETKLPFEFRENVISPESEEKVDIIFPETLCSLLINSSKKSDISLYIILLAALKILIFRYTGNEDIIVLSPLYKHNISNITMNNRVILRSSVNKAFTFKELLLEIRETVLSAYKNQDYPFEELVKSLLKLSQHQALQSMIKIQCFLKNIHYQPGQEKIKEALVFSFERVGKKIKGEILYDAGNYREFYIHQMAKHFISLLSDALVNAHHAIADIQYLTEAEINRLLFRFNNTSVGYPEHETIVGLFRAQVLKNPGNTAVVYNHKPLTYWQLEEKSNRLAWQLRNVGLQPDGIAAIMVEPSEEMVIGIMAILKAGGAYLPIEPGYPQNRIKFMLEDSKARFLLTSEEHRDKSVEGPEVIYIEEGCRIGNHSPLPIKNKPPDLAYIIYTSGTTGKPKGVMIEHRNLVRLLFNDNRLYDFGIGDTWTLFHSFCFDFSVWEIFGALLTGGKLLVLPRIMTRDPETFLNLLKEEKVTILNQTPSAFYNLIDEDRKYPCGEQKDHLNLRYVILGGEALKPSKLKSWKEKYPQIKLINMYGITETTVHVTYKEITPVEIQLGSSNIGKPIPTLNAFIMDLEHRLQPLGVTGELCVGGAGLARGYLNRAELTVEKFIENPYIPGDRIYRSGDLAKQSQNGDMEYAGRIDYQIKIRGFRVELGDIESTLSKNKEIREAVVVAREDETGQNYLCAYFVATDVLTISHLRDYLSGHLPDYMIPAHFVQIEEIPLTANGKVDRNSLPDPVDIAQESGIDYVAPRSELEKKLVTVWQEVLDRDNIGIHESFFLIGGDSIKAIQIAARMKKYGCQVEMKDIFQHPTVAELAPCVKNLNRFADQITVTGEVPLMPIQQAFFQNRKIDPHHFNQAVILHAAKGFDKEGVEAVFTKIQEHHDALRSIYKRKEKIIQTIASLPHPLSLNVYDLRNCNNGIKILEEKADEIQTSIDLEKGPLMKLGLFHLNDGDRLLIVIHHLVIDGVSWRILLEDVDTLYQQFTRGEALRLPLKTDSFKLWAEKMSKYAVGYHLAKEKGYWTELQEQLVPAIKKDFDSQTNYLEDTAILSFRLDEEETRHLLRKVNEPFGTEINDILLTALGLSIKKTFGHHRTLIALEGHGRENVLRDVDIARTIGWFTTVFPVILEFSHGEDLSRQLIGIKEILRHIPHKGLGYGLLKYLAPSGQDTGPRIGLKPQISFNYLGQFDMDIKFNSFRIAEEPVGKTANPASEREYELEFSGIIRDRQLTMAVTYNQKQFKTKTIKIFMEHYKVELRRVIHHCLARKERHLTPSDLTYKEMSIDALDQLKKTYPVEDIYKLTPMQEGILFHSVLEEAASGKKSPVYFAQLAFSLLGELNILFVQKSLNELFRRYSVLRTAFVHENVDQPLQVVLKERQVDFRYLDIRQTVPEHQQKAYIDDFKQKDQQHSFDLSSDVLMRLTVIQSGESEYYFIWSHHHILMDGWCIGILLEEYFEIYQSLLGNRNHQLPPVKSYRDFIQWLEKQDMEKARRYWCDYLASYSSLSSLIPTDVYKNNKGYKQEKSSFILDKEETTLLNKLAGKNQVTLNTIIQTAWGILLGKYNGRQDVVFGAVVSGRPSQVEGVEYMVGLFINSIPVRIRFEERMRFNDLLRRVQQEALEAEPHHYFPLAEIQTESSLKQNLFDHIMAFENYPISKRINESIGNEGKNKIPSLKLSNVESFELSHYNLDVLVFSREQLKISLEFNAYVYKRSFIERVGSHFKRILSQILKNEEIYIHQLIILSENEKSKLLKSIRDKKGRSFTNYDYKGGNPIHLENPGADFDY
jgi:amino acid adenylation domain-containing protein/non-ribosomal peptide synthase protein (TIGR01720 family)